MSAENGSNINDGHSLGKGEVDSSILSGSTRNASVLAIYNDYLKSISAVSCRTYTEDHGAIRGKSVDSVRPTFTEEPMDFDITTVRKLTALRNKPGLDFALKERLNGILKTAENINTETDPKHRDELIASFKRQWAEFIEAGGSAA